jgi:hypothetical protein
MSGDRDPGSRARGTGDPGNPVVLLFTCLFLLGIHGIANARTIRVGWADHVHVVQSSADTVISLPKIILVHDSIHVRAGLLRLAPGHDFRVDYVQRRVILRRSWPVGVPVHIRYRTLPINVPLRFQWMEPRPVPVDTSPAITPSTPVRGTQPTGSGQLRIGGSKTFSIQVGSNRDLTLEQSLRVSIQGMLADSVQVTAELSDQNLPIQPEGTTEDIREIDKVMVEIKSPRYRALLGNYDFLYKRGEFGQYDRRFDGAMAEATYPTWATSAGVASNKGRYRTYQLLLIDGNQGPYDLTDADGNTSIIVVAGSERVWLNGEPLRRGERNDYVMEYGSGQITFTNKRLITNDMRVVVDYQYTEDEFARSSFFGAGRYQSSNGAWEFSVFAVQESDNSESPLSGEYDDVAKDALRAAGDDAALATTPGWTLVGSGGSYNAVNLAEEEFKYSPGTGEYEVSFSRVGPDKGNYIRNESYFSSQFDYVGSDSGDYVPRVAYSLPMSHRLTTAQARFRLLRRLSIIAEGAISDVDLNLLSPVDDGDNVNGAGRIDLALTDAPLSSGFGLLTVTATGRQIQDGFTPLSRTISPEDNRRWGLATTDLRGQERTAELNADYRPFTGQRLDLFVGWFDRDSTAVGETHRAFRWNGSWATIAREWPQARASVEKITTESGEGADAQHGDVMRGSVTANHTMWHLTPSIGAEFETDEDSRAGLTVNGTRFGMWKAGLASAGITHFGVSGGVEQRIDQVYDTLFTRWSTSQKAFTQRHRGAIRQWHGLSGTGEYTWRRVERPLTGGNTISDVADVDLRYDPWNGLMRHRLAYRVSATRTAKRERVYLYVGPGKGEYAPRDEDETRAVLSENEVRTATPGDAEASYTLRYRDTGEYTPTVHLDASWQFNTDLSKKWKGAPDPRSNRRRPFWQRALRIVSTETFVRLSETDSTRNGDLYFVKFWRFRNFGKSPTVRGAWSIRQDVVLWNGSRAGDLRFRVQDSEDFDASLLESAGTPSITRKRAYSMRARLKLNRSTSWLGEATRESDRMDGTELDYRAERTSFDHTLTYTPGFGTELSLRNEAGLGVDPSPDAGRVIDPLSDLKAYYVLLTPTLRHAWSTRGMVRVQFEWSGVFARNLHTVTSLPLQLIDGRNSGQNFHWTVQGNYRLSSLVTATATYDGRKTPGSDIVHTGRMEIRAVF